MLWLKRIFLACLIIIAYFSVLREVRGSIIHSIHESSTYKTLSREDVEPVSTGIIMLLKNADYELSISFSGPFGMFFLFATVSLALLGLPFTNLGYLILINSTLWIIVFILFKAGIYYDIFFIELLVMFNQYLIPISNLGFVPLVYLKQKSKTFPSP